MSADEELHPPITTEQLRWSIPARAKAWGIEQQRGAGWKRLHAPKLRESRRGPGRLNLELDELSIETLREWFGAGVYRVLWIKQAGRPRVGETKPFTVLELDDEGEPIDEQPPARPAFDPPGNGASAVAPALVSQTDSEVGAPPAQARFRSRLATAQGLPPLEQVDPPRWVQARDGSPLEVFLAMQAALREQWHAMQLESKQQLEDHRAAEAQRAQLWLAALEVQKIQIQADAQVRIAEAQARADATSDRAATMAEELASMRQLVSDAMASARDGQGDQLTAALDELRERLDEMENEEDPSPEVSGAVAIVTALIEHLAPIAKQIADAKLNGAAQQIAGAAVDAVAS